MEDSIYIFFFFFIELTVNKFKANNATNRNVWCEASYNVTYTFKNILSW